MTKRAPVETKVVAATGATAGGGVVATFVIWLLGVTWQGQPADADHAASAIGAVPAPVTALVGLLILTASTFTGGYLARHTPKSEVGAINGSIIVTLAAVLVGIAALIYILGHVHLN